MKKILRAKRRFLSIVLIAITMLTIIPTNPVHAAEQYYGGQEIAWQTFPVYDSISFTNRIGTIYKFEGFTVLLQNAPAGYLWVEYSTSNGAKRGYIQIPNDEWGGRGDGLAKVTTSSTIYYGPSNWNNYQRAGSVSAGETVTILAKNDDWVYVEYNTNKGRKRGYMSYSNLSVYNRPSSFDDLYMYNTAFDLIYKSGRHTVYSGPTSLYSVVGYVENEYVMQYANYSVWNGGDSQYIEYYVNGTNELKSGFIVFGP